MSRFLNAVVLRNRAGPLMENLGWDIAVMILTPATRRFLLFFFLFFFAHSIYHLRTFSFSFSVRRRSSDGGVTRQALLPPPNYRGLLRFYRENTSALSSLVDAYRENTCALSSLVGSRRTVLC